MLRHRYIILCLFSFAVFSALKGQINSPAIIASGGEVYNTATFSNSYTIGEMCAVSTATSTGFILTQGFQQPWDLSTGISSVENSIPLSVWPNPSTGIFNLSITSGQGAELLIVVFDALGQQVYAEVVALNPGENRHLIDLSPYSDGIYFIRCIATSSAKNEILFSEKITLTR